MLICGSTRPEASWIKIMKQIFLIHGGDTFETYGDYLKYLVNYPLDLEKFKKLGLRKKKWEDKLGERLGEDFQIIRPEMPSKRNAKYTEWKIWFEKFIPFVNDEVILVGGSLGGIFLAKYLAENNFPKKIKAIFFLAAPFSDNLPEYRLFSFTLPKNMERIMSQSKNIFLYHSKDDNVVPFEDQEKYKKVLPSAAMKVFEDKGHFNVEEFPELVEDIKKLWI